MSEKAAACLILSKLTGFCLKKKSALKPSDFCLKTAIAGKRYALCGLFDVDHKYFPAVVKRFKDSEEKVQILSGCLLGNGKVEEVVFIEVKLAEWLRASHVERAPRN